MSKHTPGPWGVVEHSWARTGIYASHVYVAALDIEAEATEETRAEWEAVMDANARLIAAAPDLLEALNTINEWCCFATEEDVNARLMALQQIGVHARAAIEHMTWNIFAMRDLNRADPLGELGPRVEPTPAPAPAPFSRGDGFLVHPDGKLSTEIPPPPGPATPPVWPFPTAPAEPAGDVPDGAMWKCKHSGLYYKQVPDGFLVSAPCGEWQECVVNWERGDFDRRENFDPVAPAGDVPALKVGDKVLVLNPRLWNLTAKDVSGPWTLLYPAKSSGRKPDHYATDSGWFFWTGPHIVEGRDWERVA